MQRLHVEALSGEQFEWGKAIFSVDVEGEVVRADHERRMVRITLAFVPIPRKIGRIRRMTIYIGCTGASVQLTLAAGAFEDYSKGKRILVNYSNSTSRSRKVRISPELEGEVKEAKVKASLVKVEFGARRANKDEFEGAEWPIKATRASPQHLRWSIAVHRGEKIVRDYQEGNVFLDATCTRPGQQPSKATLEAAPSDLQFFSNEGRVLGLFGSLAARIRMKADGQALPSVSPVKLEVLLP